MPTKKAPTPREREIARKKNNAVAKTNRVEVAQNGEANPPRQKRS